MSNDKTESVKPVERNEYLETDGLYFESATHEWFHDKITTRHARNEDERGIALKNIVAFITRDKSSGRYMRVLMDTKSNAVIYDSPSMDGVGAHIDKMKVLKQFDGQK